MPAQTPQATPWRRAMNTRWLMLAILFSGTASAANHSVVAQSNMTFSPKTLTIAAGDTVTFTNAGGGHNVTARAPSVTTFRCANGCDGNGGNGNVSTADWT